jgi:membrane protease YdiL (CAAX protease family)
MAQGRRLTYALSIGWAGAAALLLSLILFALDALKPSAVRDVVTVGGLVGIVYILASYGVLRLHVPERSVRRALALRGTEPLLAVMGVLIGICLFAPSEALRAYVERLRPTPVEVLAVRASWVSSSTLLGALAIMLVVACVLPFLEEIFLRGALWSALRRNRGVLGTLIITSVATMVVNTDFNAWPVALVVGLVAGYLRAVSGSLLPSLGLNVALNGARIGAMMLGMSSVWEPFTASGTAVLGAVIFTLTLLGVSHMLARTSDSAGSARSEDGDG